MEEKIQVWYKFPHQKEIWHLAETSKCEIPSDAFILMPFDGKNPIYLNAAEAEKMPMHLFLKTTDSPKFELVDAPKIVPKNYENLVKKALSLIAKGTFEKVVLARQKKIATNLNPLTVFKNLCSAYENCFVHLVYQPHNFCSIGASPELLLAADDQRIKSVSMAGTLTDINNNFHHKEKKEQGYVTDFILRQFLAFGLDPKINHTTIKNGNIQHLYSFIESPLNSDTKTVEKLLDALHPTPAVCGSPKNESKQFIIDNEGFKRQLYAGYLGIMNQSKKHTETYVNLRCAQLFKNNAILYAGAGITMESDAHAELLETTAKMHVLEKFLL